MFTIRIPQMKVNLMLLLYY